MGKRLQLGWACWGLCRLEPLRRQLFRRSAGDNAMKNCANHTVTSELDREDWASQPGEERIGDSMVSGDV